MTERKSAAARLMEEGRELAKALDPRLTDGAINDAITRIDAVQDHQGRDVHGDPSDPGR